MDLNPPVLSALATLFLKKVVRLAMIAATANAANSKRSPDPICTQTARSIEFTLMQRAVCAHLEHW